MAFALTPRIFRRPSSFRAKAFIAVFIILLSIFGFFAVRSVFGATRTWDGGGTEGTCPGNANGWSCAQNWSSDTQPGSADIAAFDNTSDKDATIDASFAGSVLGVDINSGYDGTITQARSLAVGSSNFDQAAGTWSGGSQTLDVNGAFVISNGVHTATTGTFTVTDNFTKSGGTLTMTGATLTLDGTSGTNDSTLTCSGSLGGTVAVSKNTGDFTLSSACSITMATINTDIGTMTINGTIDITGSTFNINSGNFTISSTGNITYAGSALTFEANFTKTNGATFDLSGKTITFDGTSVNDDSTLTCTGDLGGTVAFNKSGGDFTLSSACDIEVNTINSEVGTMTINGEMDVLGTTWNMDTSTVGSDGLAISSTGIVTYAGTVLTFETGFSRANGGVFDLTGKTITFDGSGSSDDSTISCTGTLGGTARFAKASQNSDVTISSGCKVNTDSVNGDHGSFTISGTLDHSGSTFVLGGSVVTTFTISASGTLLYDGAAMSTNGNYTENGTFDSTGTTITFGGSSSGDDATIICGGTGIFEGSVTINKSSATGETTLGSSCIIGTNFTRTDGPFLNPSSGRTLTVRGNFSMSTSDTFGGSNLTLTMSGSQATQTITQNAGTMSGIYRVDKSSGTASLSTNFTTGSTCNVVEGTFDLNSRTFACGSTFTVEDGGTLELYGSETTTSPTLNSGSTVKYTGDSGSDVDAYTLKDLSYYHLTVASVDSGDTYATPNSTEDVDGNFVLSGGAFTAPSSTFTIGGNLTHSGGTFTHNSGTVTLDTASLASVISGSTTFNNLSSTTAGKDITVISGTTQTVEGTFTLTGSSGNRIRIDGSDGGTQWDLVATGQSVSYVDARDSDACGGTTIAATNSVNLGDNACWTFTQSNPNEVKVQRGTRIQRGTNIQRN